MIFRRQERQIKSVLVVEDEPLVAFDHETALQDAGYHVAATVNTVDGALDCLTREPVDLILLDLHLHNGGDGLDVARQARVQGVHVLLASGDCPDSMDGLALGCLAKPFGAGQLTRAIRAIDKQLRALEKGEAVKQPRNTAHGLMIYAGA